MAPRPRPACRGDEKGPEIIMSLTTTALFRELSQLLGKKGKKKEGEKKKEKPLLDNKEVTNED